MENLVNALYMAFAAVTFVIAFSIALFLVDSLNTTANILITERGSYYDSFSLNEIIEGNNEERNRARIVGIDTIIPTLYRYYKESFAVKILDEDGNLLQYFDTTTEGDVNSAKITIDALPAEDLLAADKRKALLSLYDADNSGNEYSYCYMFGAPWLANINKDAKTRIDMFIKGEKGYINNTYVDYSRQLGPSGSKKYIYLNYFKDRQFRESFTQYAYEGDTVSSSENGEIVTLTGSKQISTKIIIIYQLL